MSPESCSSQVSVLVIGTGSVAYGKERRAVRALKNMPGIRPFFMTSQWEDGTVAELLRQNGFDFTPASFGYLGRARPHWTLLNFALMPRLFWRVIANYRQRRCRAVLVLAITSFANALPVLLWLKWFARSRIVFYLGDTPANTGTNRLLCRFVRRTAHAIIVNSEAVRRGLTAVGIPASKVQVVYNGMQLERFQNVEPLPFRREFAWAEDTILIGYAGQFTENKGVSDFLSAAEMVTAKNDRCRFLIIGKPDDGGQCYRALEQRVQQRMLSQYIVFTGWIGEMERAYAALDVVVVPSRHEDPAPNVNIEAMAAGVPVVATRVGGSPELVADDVTGFLVDREAPAQIAECVLRLAGNRELRLKMGRAGRHRSEELFDGRRNARNVEDALIR